MLMAEPPGSSLWTRRQLLRGVGMGMAAIGCGPLLGSAASPDVNPLAPKAPPLPAKVKRVVHIFLNGGLSQVDSFDPKPALAKYAGKALPVHLRTERATGAAFPSPFKFQRYGESGIEVSEMFKNVAASADDLCVIRSMHTNVPNHIPSLMMMNCGAQIQVRPSLGSWVTYGLGSENQNLPGFVALCPNGAPIADALNWRSAFLPGAYQGTYIDPSQKEVERLIANIKNHYVEPAAQRRQLDVLARLNRAHQSERAADTLLEARIQSFELAYRMQMEASEVFDISGEPEHVKRAYGDTVHGRQMLIVRRLLERGVRFVQTWHGRGQPWDSHSEIEKNHGRLAGECDQPIGAFLKDLKQRGLLDDLHDVADLQGFDDPRDPGVGLLHADDVFDVVDVLDERIQFLQDLLLFVGQVAGHLGEVIGQLLALGVVGDEHGQVALVAVHQLHRLGQAGDLRSLDGVRDERR